MSDWTEYQQRYITSAHTYVSYVSTHVCVHNAMYTHVHIHHISSSTQNVSVSTGQSLSHIARTVNIGVSATRANQPGPDPHLAQNFRRDPREKIRNV